MSSSVGVTGRGTRLASIGPDIGEVGVFKQDGEDDAVDAVSRSDADRGEADKTDSMFNAKCDAFGEARRCAREAGDEAGLAARLRECGLSKTRRGVGA